MATPSSIREGLRQRLRRFGEEVELVTATLVNALVKSPNTGVSLPSATSSDSGRTTSACSVMMRT